MSPESGRYRLVEWPPEKKAIDIGDFYADSSLIYRTLGWEPTHAAARRPDADDRVLPRAPAPLRDGRVARRRAVSARAPIPFIDLRPAEDHAAVRDAIDRVVARGWFVLGPEVEAFEAEFAAACGAAHAVGVGNGTDAIALALRALDIGAGDEVIIPAMTAAYTGLAVVGAGAAAGDRRRRARHADHRRCRL